MKTADIVSIRLRNQKLSDTSFVKAEQVVSWLGAVQSQDYQMAKWALNLRLQKVLEDVIEKAFNEGKFLRTHVLRPTWHFIMPQDIRWMLTLTAPKVKSVMSYYNRKLELDDILFNKANNIIEKDLSGKKYLTRGEIAQHLEKHKIIARGQRLGLIVMNAELDGLICSGPRRGKQFTYALLEERAIKTKKITREESISRLATIYFQSHGPAQIKDFAWWSGLTVKEATEGLGLIKSKLEKETLDAKTYWFFQNPKQRIKSPRGFLLSIYDEYIIAYKDRSALGNGHYFEKLLSMGNALTAVVILNGEIAGTWKRNIIKDKVKIRLNLFKKIDDKEHEVIKQSAEKYGKFVGLPVILVK